MSGMKFIFRSILWMGWIGMLLGGCKVQKGIQSSPGPKGKTNVVFWDKVAKKSIETATRLKTTDTKVTSKKYLMEGPVWENENIAFRNYFDDRNGIDIFGKRVHEMVMDKVKPDDNYHQLSDWGMDILKVGNSLGAGAIGLVIGDSLYRIGPDCTGTAEVVHRGIDSATGDDYALIRFSFKNWKVQDRLYDITHEIRMQAGTHFYTSTVKFNQLVGDEYVVAGIVSHISDLDEFNTGPYSIFMTHGAQDVEQRNLGMAVVASGKYHPLAKKSGDFQGSIDHSHLVLLKPVQESVQFYFFAGWELENKDFAEKASFLKMVLKESTQFILPGIR